MTQAEISGISPFFIVSHVPSSLSFYRDRLGFEITFQGPAPDDIFFGIVQRGAAMIMFKDVGVDPLPNYKRDVKEGVARWDAYLYVPDPDALAAEFASRNVDFFEPLKDTDDGLRGFEVKDADGYWYGDYYGVMAFEVNTSVVTTPVKDWADLLTLEERPADRGQFEAIREEAKAALVAADPRAKTKDSDYVFITFILLCPTRRSSIRRSPATRAPTCAPPASPPAPRTCHRLSAAPGPSARTGA